MWKAEEWIYNTGGGGKKGGIELDERKRGGGVPKKVGGVKYSIRGTPGNLGERSLSNWQKREI